MGSQVSSVRWLGWTLAAVIVAAGGWLRGAYYEMGFRYPDEVIVSAVVGHMRQSGDWDTNWIKAEGVPAEMRQDQYNFSSYHYAVYFAYRAAKLVPALDGWRSREDGFDLYRFVSVAFATLALVGILWLGWLAGGQIAALLAGLAAMAAVLQVQDAHYVRPESFMTLLMVVVVALVWRSPRRSTGRLLLAGGLMGLLLACKVSLVLVCWVPLLAAWCHGATWRERATLGTAVGGAMAAGFALGAPGAVLQPTKFLHGVDYLARQYARGHPPHGHIWGARVGDLEVQYIVATVGWVALALALLGAVVLWRRREKEALVLLALPPLLLLGYFGIQRVFFERNLSPVVPLLLVLAGVGGAAVLKPLAPRWRWLAGLGAGALLVVVPLRITWPLVTREITSLGPDQRAAFDDRLRARFAESKWMEESLVGPGVVTKLQQHFKASTQPVLLRATDFHDEWSEHTRRSVEYDFVWERLAVQPSVFPDVPVCTLLTYHSARSTYYRITGVRAKP